MASNSRRDSLKQMIAASIFPICIVAMMWIVKILETTIGEDFSEWGIYPQTIKGLRGVVFSPFLHGGWPHLASNSVPLIMLGFGLFNFYKNKSWVVLGFIYLFSGLLTWIIGRESYHIGASGIVYGIAFFLLISSLIRKEQGLSAFSMLIIFLYGSMIWGFFPQFFPKENISWEAHLAGAISGVIIAIYYRKEGPKAKTYFDDESDNTSEEEYWLIDETKNDTEVSHD